MVENATLECGKSTNIQDFKVGPGLKENRHVCKKRRKSSDVT